MGEVQDNTVMNYNLFRQVVLSHLNSIHPFPDILLPQLQPPHRALSMSPVVLPLTRVNVSRGEAVSKQMLAMVAMGSSVTQCCNSGKRLWRSCTPCVPSHSPSLSVVLHPVSFVPRRLILVVIHCTLTQR